MGYADPEMQRKYQREWNAARRSKWLSDNGPCVDCGSWESLEVDHVDPSQKVTHNVWTWRQERRDAELAKCVVRCEECHARKSATEAVRGEQHPHSVLRTDQVVEIRSRYAAGERQADLAREFGVDKRHVWDLVHRRSRIYELPGCSAVVERLLWEQ